MFRFDTNRRLNARGRGLPHKRDGGASSTLNVGVKKHLRPEMQANDIQCSLSISITKCHFYITSYLTELWVFW